MKPHKNNLLSQSETMLTFVTLGCLSPPANRKKVIDRDKNSVIKAMLRPMVHLQHRSSQ